MKYLSYSQFKNLWFKFWTEKKHETKKSASLVSNDESLLWINSGVAGLKDYFLSKKINKNPRIVNIQKSVRTSDLSNIGLTNRHLTFFEMMGNFSIGDYFKEDAIKWAIEFLTNEKWLNFNLKNIYITYLKEDEETLNILKKNNINVDHLIPMSKKTNFWDLGVGPCGPNIEFYYDLGEKLDYEKKRITLLFDEIENKRYLEIWNVVFSQFFNSGDNNYKLLKSKNIDTGMGLERILFILQEKNSIFETDLFDNSLILLEKIFDKKIDLSSKKDKEFIRSIKIILDHSRSVSFLISDLLKLKIDINFKNKRGYVLRKIIRNACLKFYFLNIKKPILFKISECVIKKYSCFYNDLEVNKELILNLIKKEEKLFFELLENNSLIKLLKTKNKFIEGKYIFNLVSSSGIPLEIIKNIAKDSNLELDIESFNQFWNEHKKISNKKNRDFIKEWETLFIENLKSTVFVEDSYNLFAKILVIFEEKKNVLSSKKESWVIFDKTPFFAQKGGQSFDVGTLKINNIFSKIIDVQINNKKQILHKIKLKTEIKVGDIVYLEIDSLKRNFTKKNHSSTHLLHSLLKKEITNEIEQNGSFNNEKYLRLDFFSPRKILKKEIINIEEKLNKLINKKIESKIFYTTFQEAKKNKAISLFEEVYDKSRVRIVKFEDYSIELCGGTHVKNTSEIEIFKIYYFKTISKNIYRIYAITSNKEFTNLKNKYFENLYSLLNELKEKLEYLNNIEINKKIIELKQEPKLFFDYKEKLEILKIIVFEEYKKKKEKELKEIVKTYKIPNIDIKIKKNIKIITHKLSNNLKYKKDFSIFLFDYLKKEENVLICLINELKTNFNNVLLFDGTKNDIDWSKILKIKFKDSISGGGNKKKFRGLIKNIKLNDFFDFIFKQF